MAKIKLNNISNEISKILSEYSEEIEEGMIKARDKVAKESAKTLRATSPEKTGSYKQGWRVKTEGNKKIIHNKTDYQLTHLLEHGHAKVGGGRVAARVHIKPVEEKAIKDYIEATEKLIRR